MKKFIIKLTIFIHGRLKGHFVHIWDHPLSKETTFYCIRCSNTDHPFGGSYAK